jgi:hypothetical protein
MTRGSGVDELTISREDVTSLARTLAGLDLEPAQRALLSTIIAIATDAIGRQESGLVVQVHGLPSIEEQFAAAFVPGVREFSAGEESEAVAKIGLQQTYSVNKIGR